MSHWEAQALPVLTALHSSTDESLKVGFLQVGRGERGAKRLGLDIEEGELFDTLFALRDLGYVEFNEPEYASGPSASFTSLRITGRGLQVLGEWPRFEAMLSPVTLAAALEQLAAFAPDDETEEQLKGVAAYVRQKGPEVVRSLVVSFGSAWVKHQLGLG